MKRCSWCNLKNPLYIKYHDNEWGILNLNEKYLFEMLILESFQAGLSWECVLNKREEKSGSIIEMAKNYIKNNYHKDISLDDVSREVNISPYYFSKLFKETTGENFIEYLTNLRMDKAKELLETTECSMKEICVRTGYSDPNYFSRSFKKNVGVTPTVYKENRGKIYEQGSV